MAAPSPSTTSSSITAAHVEYRPFRLLDLPCELRLMIFEEVLAASEPPVDADPSIFKKLEPNLMRTCKTVRAEILKPFFAHLALVWHDLSREVQFKWRAFAKIRSGNLIGRPLLQEALDEILRWWDESADGRMELLAKKVGRVGLEIKKLEI